MNLNPDIQKTTLTPCNGLGFRLQRKSWGTQQPILRASPRYGSNDEDSYRPSIPEKIQKILLAEDDPDIRYIMARVLDRNGFQINAVSDGEQAWKALCQEPYDMLITDQEMPRLLGLELIERMRSTGMKLPVIVASGSLFTETIQDHPRLQIAAILTKPFTLHELLNITREILQQSHENNPPNQPTFHQLNGAQ